MKVLIIEDEAPAYRRLNKLLEENHPNLEVVEVIDSISEAIKWINNHQSPDLIFSDIQLSDGLSFDIYREVKLACPIIFTTAYDEYMLEAFQSKGIDYLLKPIEKEELARSIQKYEDLKKQFSVAENESGNLQDLLRQIQSRSNNYKDRFLVKLGARWQPLPVEEIAYFCFRAGSTEVFTIKGKSYPLDPSLDELESQVDPKHFFRVNRQFLAHVRSIQQIHQHFKGRLKVQLHPNPQIDVLVSRERARSFKNWLS
jgi:DNA-binding LytR/AlgR family response regulator